MTDLSRRCTFCRWFDPRFAPDEDEHEALGLCEWPADRLPYSLRYGNRERMVVSPLDGADCPCFEPAMPDLSLAERDALAAENERLREALADLCDWIEHEVGAELPFDARRALEGGSQA